MAIYGMVESNLLWYELYVSVLKDVGFQLNPYHTCVANKDIKGKQCTIAWYVGDNKVSHVEQDVTDDFVNKVEEWLPVLTVKKVSVNTFLGMKIRFLKKRRIEINMKE